MSDDLLENNIRWVAGRMAAEPDVFRRLAAGPGPDQLWIGCIECRIAANELIGLGAGAVVVHRNLANQASPHDVNFLSALQFSVEVLKIRRVIVCGHYGCGGVAAALAETPHGLVDHWLQSHRQVFRQNVDAIQAILDPDARVNEVCERNVLAQVANLAGNPIVEDAWRRGQPLAIHGWIYATEDGLLRDLETTIDSLRTAQRLLQSGPARALASAEPRRRRARGQQR